MRVEEREEELFRAHAQRVYRSTDRLFAVLIVVQWAFAILLAVVLSPYAWAGRTSTIHAHVWIAVVLGGILASLPLALIATQPGSALTRHVIAVSQMLWSALLIHLSGGRIETHFHVFGSLAFLAFYRDWKILVPATLVVAGDHLIRQLFWPESVYGMVNPEWWRFLEHAFWVAFEDVVLIMACVVAVREMRSVARSRAEYEALSEASEHEKTRALDQALSGLEESQAQLVRAEKLAAVGQLAASVGHELRNPLAAVRNANTFVGKRLKEGGNAASDPRVIKFVGLIDHELAVCTRIINDLLDFARERPPVATPCSLRALADEAVALLPAHTVTVVNEVPEGMPLVEVDHDQLRQVLVNVIQNAVEAIPAGRPGAVTVRAEGGGELPVTITVADDGPGIPPDTLKKIFEPLFTTKAKGTGLGLAIVANVVKRHGGRVEVASEPGAGTTFTITLPPAAPATRAVGVA